jgi:hypothetical protein
MTEPDEATLWAREQSAQFWESLAAKGLPPETVAAHVALARSGGYDSELEQEAEGRRNWLEGYRAGQAASAERIKALEEAVVQFMTADELGPVEGRDESFQAYRLAFDVLPEPEWSARVEHRLNRLKEADQ